MTEQAKTDRTKVAVLGIGVMEPPSRGTFCAPAST
ncbi:hypothetical protein P3T39_007105 [Kitasatospora sp. GP82]|nr:hypothetical protein [Kitasatospora sp. GP82]